MPLPRNHSWVLGPYWQIITSRVISSSANAETAQTENTMHSARAIARIFFMIFLLIFLMFLLRGM